MQKKWYQSKAIYGAIVTFVGGGLTALGYADAGNLIMTTGIGLGIAGVRMAQK